LLGDTKAPVFPRPVGIPKNPVEVTLYSPFLVAVRVEVTIVVGAAKKFSEDKKLYTKSCLDPDPVFKVAEYIFQGLLPPI
jgi:hypothetical protein